MSPKRPPQSPFSLWSARLWPALLLGLTLAAPAFAQVGGGGTQLRKETPKKPAGDGGRDVKQDRGSSGSELGWFIKLAPPKESESEQWLGTLSIKPIAKNAKTLRLLVPKSDTPYLALNAHAFENEALNDVLRRGLLCTASWRYAETDGKKKSKKKELASLRLEVVDLVGRIEEISDDAIVVRALPAAGQTWPGEEKAAAGTRTSRPEPKSKTPRPRKLKLKVLEDVAKYVDSENNEVSLADFETGQEVTAKVAYGKPVGYLISLAAKGAKSEQAPPGGGRGGQTGIGGGRAGRDRT